MTRATFAQTPAFAPSMSTCQLSALALRQNAVVNSVRAAAGADEHLVARLGSLGFLDGERVCVLRRGPGGREPLAVQIGASVFALRLVEAQCVWVDAA